jgi:hypothetical protein
VVRAKEAFEPEVLGGIGKPEPSLPSEVFLTLDHQGDVCHKFLSISQTTLAPVL